MAKKIRGKNEGSLSKRSNGSWRAQVSIDGKRISFGAKTKVECQVWLRKMLDQVDKGYDLAGNNLTLEEFLERWLNTCKTSLRAKTTYQYAHVVRKHIKPYIGDILIKDLKPGRVESFYAQLVEVGVGVRTIRLTHSILHRALEIALKYGLIMRNPAHRAELPRRRHPEMQVLDESQVSQLLVAAHNSRHEALYHLAVTTGMRQGELFGLQWSDLKWNGGTLYVRRQVQVIRGQGWHFEEPKTRAGLRPIKLGEGSLQSLRLHKERQNLQKALAGDRWNEYGLIFTSNVGTPLNPSNLRLDFNRILEAAGLPKIRFHDLRHTAASLMLNHGIPVLVVSKILGHSKPSVTLDIYGHVYHEMQNEAAQIMDELVTPISVGVVDPVAVNSD